MTQVCELARSSGDLDRFVSVVGAYGGRVETRWEYCLQAAGDLEPELLHRILASLEVRAVELRSVTSRDSVDLINRLAEAWTPKDHERATRLGNALFKLLTDVGPTAGIVDLSVLHHDCGQNFLVPLVPRRVEQSSEGDVMGDIVVSQRR